MLTLAFFSRRLGRGPGGGHAPCGRSRQHGLSVLDRESPCEPGRVSGELPWRGR
ncbi:hypothetical protein SNL152K_2955 [Streptomyces sp. NL15-2K]|nr:hypothetical protein SNL152K_2955 [Streptomyces sp. NL15-2K]